MRLTMLAMVLGSILAMPLHAQQAAPQAAVADPPVSTQAVPGDGIRTEATVVVTGEQPGPGLWLVRKGGHDLWILGTLNPLPAGMRWQSKQVEQVIANAQEVIRAPRVSFDVKVGFFRGLTLLPSMLGARKNPDGKKLQVVKYTDYSGRAVRTLYPSREALRSAWANPDTRTEVLHELTERGISFAELASSSEQPDADPFDLLCHLAWNAPLLTRRQRAETAKRQTQDLFAQHGDTAREILTLLLDRYIERGILQFNALSELMKVQPFDRYGSPSEIATRHFGGVRGMKDAVYRLQTALYQ